MKYFVGGAIAASMILGASVASGGGFAMCFRPGLGMSGAHFGYKTDLFFAGAGLEFVSASFGLKVTVTDTDYYSGGTTTYTNSAQVGATLLLPQVAGRFYFSTVGGTGAEGLGIRPYVGLSAFYAVATAKVVVDMTEDTTAARMFRDALRGTWGGTVGGGAEYQFSRNFSIGGEFGVRPIFVPTRFRYEDYYPKTKVVANTGFGVTYVALGLNFYF